jgi:hypothetical protein
MRMTANGFERSDYGVFNEHIHGVVKSGSDDGTGFNDEFAGSINSVHRTVDSKRHMRAYQYRLKRFEQ